MKDRICENYNNYLVLLLCFLLTIIIKRLEETNLVTEDCCDIGVLKT